MPTTSTRRGPRARRACVLAVAIAVVVVATACASAQPNAFVGQASVGAAAPVEPRLVAPAPIENSSGKFVSPYTSDGTIAPWVTKGRAAKLGGAVGNMAGRKAAQKALGASPLGAIGGAAVGEAVGREMALRMVGGDSTMRATSDLSFERVEDLILYMHVKHYKADDKEFAEVKELTGEIYPELATHWDHTINAARIAAINRHQEALAGCRIEAIRKRVGPARYDSIVAANEAQSAAIAQAMLTAQKQGRLKQYSDSVQADAIRQMGGRAAFDSMMTAQQALQDSITTVCAAATPA